MKRYIILIIMLNAAIAFAKHPSSLTLDTSKNIVLSIFGTAVTEDDNTYGYYFQLRHKDDNYFVDASLIDLISNTVVIHEIAQATLTNHKQMQWKIGKAFLEYNFINNSWIFGVKLNSKHNFNFKIDMLNRTHTTTDHPLSHNVFFIIEQTGRLNGHIKINNEEKFISSDQAWYQQIWLNGNTTKTFILNSLECSYQNNNQFFSLALMDENHNILNTTTKWLNAYGERQPLSQFIKITQDKKLPSIWQVTIPYPQNTLLINNVFTDSAINKDLVLGKLMSHPGGFCVYNTLNLPY